MPCAPSPRERRPLSGCFLPPAHPFTQHCLMAPQGYGCRSARGRGLCLSVALNIVLFLLLHFKSFSSRCTTESTVLLQVEEPAGTVRAAGPHPTAPPSGGAEAVDAPGAALLPFDEDEFDFEQPDPTRPPDPDDAPDPDRRAEPAAQHGAPVPTEEALLQEAARRAAGVLLTPSGDARYEGTVVVTAATAGFLGFVRNWMCRADALRLKYLVVAMDRQLFDIFTDDRAREEHGIAPSPGRVVALHDVSADWNMSSADISGRFHSWQQGAYVPVVCGKPKAVSIILDAGLHVLFLDTDVGLIRLPTGMIPRNPLVHYTHQPNIGERKPTCTDPGNEAGNTGVYWARGSPIMARWMRTTSDLCKDSKTQTEQPLFWQLFQTIPLARTRCNKLPVPEEPYICSLSPCVAPTGFANLFKTPAALLSWVDENGGNPGHVYLVHPNYVRGSNPKVEFLKKLKLWVANPQGCDAHAQDTLREQWNSTSWNSTARQGAAARASGLTPGTLQGHQPQTGHSGAAGQMGRYSQLRWSGFKSLRGSGAEDHERRVDPGYGARGRYLTKGVAWFGRVRRPEGVLQYGSGGAMAQDGAARLWYGTEERYSIVKQGSNRR